MFWAQFGSLRRYGYSVPDSRALETSMVVTNAHKVGVRACQTAITESNLMSDCCSGGTTVEEREIDSPCSCIR